MGDSATSKNIVRGLLLMSVTCVYAGMALLVRVHGRLVLFSALVPLARSRESPI